MQQKKIGVFFTTPYKFLTCHSFTHALLKQRMSNNEKEQGAQETQGAPKKL
jgi:hypothetical protein